MRVWYNTSMDILRKNDRYTVCIEAYSAEAFGVCHVHGCAVFVPRTLPGEEWEIRIVKVEKNFAYGRAETPLRLSPARAESDCGAYGKCGGCDCRHMFYEEELRFKLQKVNDALTRIGKQTVQARRRATGTRASWRLGCWMEGLLRVSTGSAATP